MQRWPTRNSLWETPEEEQDGFRAASGGPPWNLLVPLRCLSEGVVYTTIWRNTIDTICVIIILWLSMLSRYRNPKLQSQLFRLQTTQQLFWTTTPETTVVDCCCGNINQTPLFIHLINRSGNHINIFLFVCLCNAFSPLVVFPLSSFTFHICIMYSCIDVLTQ